MQTFKPYAQTFILDYTKPTPFTFTTYEDLYEHPWCEKFQKTAGFREFVWRESVLWARIYDKDYVVGHVAS
jgi:hypothetical protein